MVFRYLRIDAAFRFLHTTAFFEPYMVLTSRRTVRLEHMTFLGFSLLVIFALESGFLLLFTSLAMSVILSLFSLCSLLIT